MKSLRFLLVLIFLFLLRLHITQSLGIRRVPPMRRRPISSCDLPSLANGKILRRQKGRMLMYVCNQQYKLIGSKYATCSNGRWDSPIPFCARAGCPEISTEEFQDHMVFYENNKVMVTLRCRSDHILKGASVSYCDGEAWDRSLGRCHPSAGMDNLSCDFESEDLCGWSHDENEDFRWARRSGQPNSMKQRTGPRTDHTVGVLHEGHYMLMESFEHEKGERALFFSPIFSAEKSKDACFRFFYHMYGLLVGSLRIYVKPVSADMDMLYSDPKYVYFDKKGNQRNIWREGKFSFEEIDESFQIIIEGVLRSSLYGDIAVDDVELLQGDACLPDLSFTTTEAIEAEDNFATILSCENRCGEQSRSNKTDSCDCHTECSESYSCCPDFGKVCLSSDPPPTRTTPTTTMKVTETVTQTKRPPSTQTARTTHKPVPIKSSEFVEPVTNIKILPIALDNNPPGDFGVVSMHKTAIFVSIVGCVCLGLIVIILLRHYQKRRRVDPEFYQKRKERPSHASQSAQEEFSEVRYLTGEEQLDFSLAEPSNFGDQLGSVISDATEGLDVDCDKTGNESDKEPLSEVSSKKSKSKTAHIINKKDKTHDKRSYRKGAKDNEGLLEYDFDDAEDW